MRVRVSGRIGRRGMDLHRDVLSRVEVLHKKGEAAIPFGTHDADAVGVQQ